MLSFFIETLVFSLIMVVSSFLVSYTTDLLMNRSIEWWPNHAWGMINGLVLTSVLVYVLFSKTYISYKCS